MESTANLSERIVVRNLQPDDLERVIKLDAKIVGRERGEYYKRILQRNLRETGVQVSLAAEVEREFAGFLLARAWYGEFGRLEPVAVLEAIAVHPHHRREGVGKALLDQLELSLRALGLTKLRTQVEWRDLELLAFFHRRSFEPARALLLECDLAPKHG
jgi:ribosomal protein S18 acetylase RimI-like enzyme